MSDIVLTNVQKNYGGKTALRPFSHTFEEGKITCLMGASGCGKTTLLKILAGFEAPDLGTVQGIPESIAFVFQEDRLCEDFSALSNIRMVCGKRKSKEEIIRHLTELGLKDEANKPVRTFSGGMKRRIAIARAILYDADLLLLDEPFKGLDEQMRKTVMDYVLRYTQGKTVLCVTHDEAEAEFMGAEIVHLAGKREEKVE